jgi:hypothetical protein
MRTFLAAGQLLIVETSDDRYLGTAEVVGGNLVIRSGYVGRPTLLEVTDVETVTVASDHPDLEDA